MTNSIIKGIVATFDRDNIDTDQIIPTEYLKSIKKFGFGDFLFDWGVFFHVVIVLSTRVEAAGIEPASRDIFMKASTRVVDCLILARVDSNRQDATRASRKQI